MTPYVDISESTHVAAAPETVWALVADVTRHPEFAGPKSITKEVPFDGPLVPGARWVAHEKFGPQKFDAPSDVTEVDVDHRLSWVSYPPMRDADRGEGGRVLWGYVIEAEPDGCRLTHTMQVLPPERGAGMMKAMYVVLNLPKRQREGIRTSLAAIKAAAEQAAGEYAG